MIIKKFKIFENASLTNETIKNIVDYILTDLSDLNDNFSWKLNYRGSLDDKFSHCLLELICYDNIKFDGSAIDILVSNKKQWIEILNRLVISLDREGFNLYDQVESFTKVIPGKINSKWHAEVKQNPRTFETTDTYMSKEFLITEESFQ